MFCCMFRFPDPRDRDLVTRVIRLIDQIQYSIMSDDVCTREFVEQRKGEF